MFIAQQYTQYGTEQYSAALAPTCLALPGNATELTHKEWM